MQAPHPNQTHGLTRTKEWTAWMGMRSRVKYDYEQNRSNKYYAGKGVTISPEWDRDFIAFLTHIGPAPSRDCSVDRIDGAEGYIPGNVRWATLTEQNRNKGNNIIVPWRGADRLMIELAAEYNLPYQTLHYRLRRAGWDIERALTTPVRPTGRT